MGKRRRSPFLRSAVSILAAAGILCVLPCAEAEKVLAEDREASEDQITAASVFSEELSDTGKEEYYRKSSVSWLTSMIRSMASENAFRLVLDSGYPEIAGSALNASESARSIWQVLADGYAKAPWNFILDRSDGKDTYSSVESAAAVSNILRRLLGAGDERLADFDGITDPEELWNRLSGLSGGDTYTWEDSVYGGGDHPVKTGDQVYFRLSAFCGGSGGEQSYTLHRKQVHPKSPVSPGAVSEWITAEDPDTGERKGAEGDPAEPAEIPVTKAYEVSFAYVGMVLASGPEGIRCICGNLDITRTGQSGGSAAGEVRSVSDGNGTVTYFPAGSDPEWFVSVTTRFCHNEIDTDRMMENLYSTYVVESGPNRGNLISFDINDPKLVSDLEGKTGYTEEQCLLLANEMRLLYMTEVLEAKYGLTVAESIAWQEIILHLTEGDLSGEGIRRSLPEHRAEEYGRWLESAGEAPDTGNFMAFLQESLEKDEALASEIRARALTGTGTIEENILADMGRIMTWYVGVRLTDREIRRLYDGTVYRADSLEGYLSGFLSGLADGRAEIGYLTPYAAGTGTSGLLEWIEPDGDGSWSVPKEAEFIYIEAVSG